MNFKKWVKSIQAAAYNGARTVVVKKKWPEIVVQWPTLRTVRFVFDQSLDKSVKNFFVFFHYQTVKQLMSLETYFPRKEDYIYFLTKELQEHQTLLFGKILQEIDLSSMMDGEQDGELVQNGV